MSDIQGTLIHRADAVNVVAHKAGAGVVVFLPGGSRLTLWPDDAAALSEALENVLDGQGYYDDETLREVE